METTSSTRALSVPNLNTSGIDMLPEIRDIANATNVKISSSIIPARSTVILRRANPVIRLTANLNRLPTKQKIAITAYFPATRFFFDTGIIIAYRVQLELSSKVKAVTIIILHRTALVMIYADAPDVGWKPIL